jgi:DNA topoisomerase IB
VWISPHPNGHVQATGVDDAGRTQYLYHPRWVAHRSGAKHQRVRELAGRLPAFRRRLARDLAQPGLGRDRVAAGALHLLDLGLFRTGGEEYAADNGSHGVATLERGHVAVRGSVVTFRFPAKAGLSREATLDDAPVAALVRSLRRAPHDGSDRLLRWRDGRRWHDLSSTDLNGAFRELVGADSTVKDLRTWAATLRAGLALSGMPEPVSARERRRQEQAACDQVAEQLGNTRAVARRSYVDPVVFDADAQGRLRPALRRALSAADCRRLDDGGPDDVRNPVRAERALVRLLTSRDG